MGWRLHNEDKVNGILRILVFLYFLIFFVLGLSAQAQTSVTDGVLINADNMYRDLEKRTVRLEGHVQVVFQGQHLTCDRATINLKIQQITAEGDVILNNERVHVEGKKVVFNYKTNTGHIYDGFVQSGQVVFVGDVIEKVGESRYLATNASFTACETCPPGWSFSGKKIDAELGGYARIKRPVFRVGRVPIMILPSIIVPLKSARQSGVLVPTMSYSGKGGWTVGESYFWAINRSSDATFTARWYELRGYKAQTEYRYILSPESSGNFQGALMEDRAFREEENKSPTRWFGFYNHHYLLPNNYTQRAEIRQLSDLRYLRDFPDEVLGHGDPALQNKASISKSTETQVASIEGTMYTNLLKSDPFARNEDAVHRLPEIRYAFTNRPIGDTGLYFRFDMQYVNYARDGFSYDDLNIGTDKDSYGFEKRVPLNGIGDIRRDGRYDPNTDLWRTGQRLDMRPTVSYPFQVGQYFDVVPSFAFRETQYRFNPTGDAERGTCTPGSNPDSCIRGFSETAARRYVESGVRVKSEFSHVYGRSNPSGRRLKHALEPEVGFLQVSSIRRPDHPFFGDQEGQNYSQQYDPLNDNDLNNLKTNKVQFDYEDRTYERRTINLALNNRFTRKFFSGGTPTYKTAALYRLSSAYDYREAQGRGRRIHPWSTVDNLLEMHFKHFDTAIDARYNVYSKTTNASSRLRLMATPQNYFEVTYSQNYSLTPEDTVAENGVTRNVGYGAGFLTRYVEANGGVDYSVTTSQINSWHYGLMIRPPGKCWTIKLDHQQVVNGDPNIHASFSFDFGGGTAPPDPSWRYQSPEFDDI